MKKLKQIFYQNFFVFILFNLCLITINSENAEKVYDINEDITGRTDYKKVSFDCDEETTKRYFKHSVKTIPSSRIGAIRFDFNTFNEKSKQNEIICGFFEENIVDSELINQLESLSKEESACIGGIKAKGVYEGIVEYHKTKKKLGILLRVKGELKTSATVYVRTTEFFASTDDTTINVDQKYSLVPITIVISEFRSKASKILFYSQTRELYMYYAEENTPYPEKLFSGNIMNVYTNPLMVKQKYHNANTMVLLNRNFTEDDKTSELFQVQIVLLSSNYLLDYYVSDNPNGRSKNTPLAVNMTECSNPYYVILNYNKPEKETSLYIDQIYGRISSIAVATTFTSVYWEEMLYYDMINIDIENRKHTLPEFSDCHIDVYKVECEIPSLLNFYYIDEKASIPKLTYGKVVIATLKPKKFASFLFEDGIVSPELTVEVFSPEKSPMVLVDDGQNKNLVTENLLLKTMPYNTAKGLVIKERGGDSNTRVIIKIGYNTENWDKVDDNIRYNPTINMFVFSFPNNMSKLNYTDALLETVGKSAGDNVKYCYGTNIGSAILPSNENCYRVSLDNKYTLKVMNPLVMHRDYNYNDSLNYYVSIKPVNENEKMDVSSSLTSYNTKERNIEGFGNLVEINSLGEYSSILTAPAGKDFQIFLQVHQCKQAKVEMELVNAYDPSQIIVEKEEIPYENKNFFKTYENIYLESEIKLTGSEGTNVFVKHQGIRIGYKLRIRETQNITFNEDLNQLIVESPIKNYEKIRYTVYVDEPGTFTEDISICSFVENKIKAKYNKTVESSEEIIPININFQKLKFDKGKEFEAIVYSEQMFNSKMVFLSKIIKGTVGEIKIEFIKEIHRECSGDGEYVYAEDTAKKNDLLYYFTYLPYIVSDVQVGAFSIETDPNMKNGFTDVTCAFVNDGDGAIAMVEAIDNAEDNSYCYGGRSTTKKNRYNYIFKYLTENNGPKRLVIKISNMNLEEGNFTIYVRKADNVQIEKTGFDEEKEYGKQEEYKKSVIPYIIDLKTIRGESTTDYISKMLIYSQFLEMQMYYLDSTEKYNSPQLLFKGNLMMVYTKPTLAEQKYHGTKLILLSESLLGQEHSGLGNKFRFHTKMFRSEDQLEYFVSNEKNGRTLNRPLSLEMNICTTNNNKYYYILNYNKEEEEPKILYLDLVFGSIKKARIASEITEEKWNLLVKNKMEIIKDYTYYLINRPQHIDIVEIECDTPLLANIYYNDVDQEYSGLQLGDIAIKYIQPQQSLTITLDNTLSGSMFYSIAAFNPKENPDITFTFGKTVHTIKENAVNAGFIVNIPESFSVKNNADTNTRFIFKLGYAVETDWTDEKEDIKGKLYSKDNKFVYRFPKDNYKRNYTNVTILVKSLDIPTLETQNVKFCYSTSVGMPIYVSLENCFRTGTSIPISLTFINPLIATKIYKDYTDSYFITLSPFYESAYIKLEITEGKYDVEERNFEGIANLLVLDEKNEKSTILSLSETTKKTIYIQLSTTGVETKYNILNAYTQEMIYSGTVKKVNKFNVYELQNKLIETQIKFIGEKGDKIFVKHIGLTDYKYDVVDYRATFDETKNEVNVIKPMKNEAFRMTIIVGQKGRFKDYTLCTFAELDESKYETLGDYVSTFNSEHSDIVVHFIDFSSFGYHEGDEFDLLVYAVQINNAKFEFIYNVISAVVGKVGEVIEIYEKIPGKDDYASQIFEKNTTNNYLFYVFTNPSITGEVASIKIKPADETSLRVSKVGCVFVKKGANAEEMISEVNKAVKEGTSVCFGETEDDNNGFDVLVNAKDVANSFSKLVIQVIYGFGEDTQEKNNEKNEGGKLNITLRTCGMKVTENIEYNEDEELAIIPYVLDLKEIRGDDTKENYVSKVLLYSTNHEMQMFYLKSGAPKELFSGNIMFVYTNPKVINEKYSGASTMILLTDSLSTPKKSSWGEQFKFKANFFDSKTSIQYYVSGNKDGRLLNNPTSIEMLSCDQPFYWIMNYNKVESDRTLHIDIIFGEKDSFRIATQLNDPDWYSFISNMKRFFGNEYSIKGQDKYHIDVLEVKCKTPMLINVYYTDPKTPKITNLDQGDISLLSLDPGNEKTLTLNTGIKGDFIYSFSVMRANGFQPNVFITFDDDELQITRNGIFNKNSNINYPTIKVTNKQLYGSDLTKVIFKFGYNIEKTFTKIQNDMYQLQDKNKTVNLFAYIFKNGDDKLNYTKVNFTVSTSEPNVKFCYSSNLGAFIDPSLQNCYRIGSDNPYTISLLNPYIMYKPYYTGENDMPYYVSFRTENKDNNITIKPTIDYYTTKERNLEGYPNSLKINKIGGSILTRPANNTIYMIVQMEVCTPSKTVNFEFKNAYYNKSLGYNGVIHESQKHEFRIIENTNLDTEVVFNTDYDTDVKVFVKHLGSNVKYTPVFQEMNIKFNSKTQELSFNRPFVEEELIMYTIYLDRKDYLIKQGYTLCSIAEISKLAHYTQSLESKEENVVVKLDFDQEELKGYESFDVLILAEEVKKGKLMTLSEVFQSNIVDGEGTKATLIIIIVVVSVIIVAGGIVIYFVLKAYKNKPIQNIIVAKPTTLDDISSTSQGEKMLDSMAQSQASENALNN